MNYVIFFVLLSQLYGALWVNVNQENNTLLRSFVGGLRSMYTMPFNMVDYQCYQDSALNPKVTLGEREIQVITMQDTSIFAEVS